MHTATGSDSRLSQTTADGVSDRLTKILAGRLSVRSIQAVSLGQSPAKIRITTWRNKVQRVCHDTRDSIQVPHFSSAIRTLAVTQSSRIVFTLAMASDVFFPRKHPSGFPVHVAPLPAGFILCLVRFSI